MSRLNFKTAQKAERPRMMLEIKTLKLFTCFIFSLLWKCSSQCLVVTLNLHGRLASENTSWDRTSRRKMFSATEKAQESRWETIFHFVNAYLASCLFTYFLFYALSRLGAFESFLSPSFVLMAWKVNFSTAVRRKKILDETNSYADDVLSSFKRVRNGRDGCKDSSNDDEC